jgi:hypothetical protein
MSLPIVRSHQCHYALFYLRQQGAYRNYAPPVGDAALQTLYHIPYQCQLSCLLSGSHPRSCDLTRLAAPLRGRATPGSSVEILPCKGETGYHPRTETYSFNTFFTGTLQHDGH